MRPLCVQVVGKPATTGHNQAEAKHPGCSKKGLRFATFETTCTATSWCKVYRAHTPTPKQRMLETRSLRAWPYHAAVNTQRAQPTLTSGLLAACLARTHVRTASVLNQKMAFVLRSSSASSTLPWAQPPYPQVGISTNQETLALSVLRHYKFASCSTCGMYSQRYGAETLTFHAHLLSNP